MGSDICQTPYAPDATYCKKDGKHHRGDKATIVEQSNNEGQSLIVGYTTERTMRAMTHRAAESLNISKKEAKQRAAP